MFRAQVVWEPERDRRHRRLILTVLGRSLSLPLGLALLAIPTMIVLAWSAFLLISASTTTNIAVAPAPVAPNVTIIGSNCTKVSGNGSIAAPVLVGLDLSCSYSNFDNTSVFNSFISIRNDEAQDILVTPVLPAADPCVDVVRVGSGNTATPGANVNFTYQWSGTGDGATTGTFLCAGSANIGPFLISLDITVP